jgi:accessory gene regulator protein AgrB
MFETLIAFAVGLFAGAIITAIVFHLSHKAVITSDSAYIKAKLDALWTKLGGT